MNSVQHHAPKEPSTTREYILLCAGCLAVGREDGIVEVWDLLDRCHEPVMACTVAVAAVTSLCFSPAEEKSDSNAKIASHRQYLAAGACCNLHMHEGVGQSASSVCSSKVISQRCADCRGKSVLVQQSAGFCSENKEAIVQWHIPCPCFPCRQQCRAAAPLGGASTPPQTASQ